MYLRIQKTESDVTLNRFVSQSGLVSHVSHVDTLCGKGFPDREYSYWIGRAFRYLEMSFLKINIAIHTLMTIGILAYGSLIDEPGHEIRPFITDRITTETPFPVEFGRFSTSTRGGAPTVVPHTLGKPVAAEILVLSDEVQLAEAKSMLWRRERGKMGSGEEYQERGTKNAVLVRVTVDFCGIDHVLYTDFNPEGKISSPDPHALAVAAVESVRKAVSGKDGISYLMNLISKGVITKLTGEYRQEILHLTNTTSLEEALQKTLHI